MENDSSNMQNTIDLKAPSYTPQSHLSDNNVTFEIEPDLEFIQSLTKQSGNFFKKCFQCGTCSSTCTLSPDNEPFPGKEMIWAVWGMKDRLLKDLDVWLCFQCNDCSSRCPRGGRPGDVLAAVRRKNIMHYSFPRFMGQWVSQPQFVPLLLAIPVILLSLALYYKDSLESTLGITQAMGEPIIYNYSSLYPHWLLNSLFFFFSFLALLAVIIGVARFWRDLKSNTNVNYNILPKKGIFPSIISTLKNIILHTKFDMCEKSHNRYWSHILVFFGFISLTIVTLWVITISINPLIQGEFIYPFGFFSPWKMLANIGGLAVLGGSLLMIRDRIKDTGQAGAGTYYDWSLIATILIVVLTGFATEVLHYVRLEPHRHIAYFVHLVFVFCLLIYLPYSKLAHLIYRTVALVFAEQIGRVSSVSVKQEESKKEVGELV